MSDLEGLTRNLMKKGYSEVQILERIIQEYQDFNIWHFFRKLITNNEQQNVANKLKKSF